MKQYCKKLNQTLICASLSIVAAGTVSANDFSERPYLLGDLGRTKLAEDGVSVSSVYMNTFMVNAAGGIDRGTAYKGNLSLSLDFDLDKLVGLHGGRLFISGMEHHGNSLSRKEIGDSLGNRKDDVEDSMHLFEIGYEQWLFDDICSIKLGQIAVSSDFFGSASNFFVHDSFNWQPNGQSAAPSGPDSALGLRLKIEIAEDFYVQGGVYDNGTSGSFGDDRNDKYGTKWSLPQGNRSVWFFEGGLIPQTETFAVWPVIKIGGWIDDGQATDLVSSTALSSNSGVYLILEKTVWTDPNDVDQGLHLFGRFNWSEPDRNQWESEFNIGMLCTGIIPGRDADIFGLSFTHAETSSEWRSAQGTAASEQVVEAKYLAMIAPWLDVAPFMQIIVNPGGPDGRDLHDALVFGLQSSVVF